MLACASPPRAAAYAGSLDGQSLHSFPGNRGFLPRAIRRHYKQRYLISSGFAFAFG